MKVDDRGRVRFTFKNVRYELTRTSFAMYERVCKRERPCRYLDTAIELAYAMDYQEFREKLRRALNLLHDYTGNKVFTTAIHVPVRKVGEF
ncbi:MAG: hypothetical protein AMJ55_00270 [Gammaproteobacteria bacterium SG8_15]|nr:MAG: hypothetical protein AMJ55_00270 [Gammaproteobacteria bacterium SG8_15]